MYSLKQKFISFEAQFINFCSKFNNIGVKAISQLDTDNFSKLCGFGSYARSQTVRDNQRDLSHSTRQLEKFSARSQQLNIVFCCALKRILITQNRNEAKDMMNELIQRDLSQAILGTQKSPNLWRLRRVQQYVPVRQIPVAPKELKNLTFQEFMQRKAQKQISRFGKEYVDALKYYYVNFKEEKSFEQKMLRMIDNSQQVSYLD